MNVAIVQQANYDPEAVYTALKQTCEAADMPDPKGKTLLVKPNILSGSLPESAVATHPAVAAAMVRLLLEGGAAKVLVGDSPASHPSARAGERSGIKPAVEAVGAEWAEMGGEYALAAPEGRIMKRFIVTDFLQQVDGVISLSKLKTHQLMGFTGAVKNLFGVIPGLKKSEYHLRFSDREDFGTMLLDLYGAVKPLFNVMDGITAMEGPGPGNGYPRDLGILLASRDAVALDAAACRVVGYLPEEIPTWHQGYHRDFAVNAENEITYPVLSPSDCAVLDFKKIQPAGGWSGLINLVPSVFKTIAKDLYVPKPRFSAKKCIRCSDCVKICPAVALTLTKGEKKPRIDYGVCVRCYCCHEVCPADAIVVKRGF